MVLVSCSGQNIHSSCRKDEGHVQEPCQKHKWEFHFISNMDTGRLGGSPGASSLFSVRQTKAVIALRNIDQVNAIGMCEWLRAERRENCSELSLLVSWRTQSGMSLGGWILEECTPSGRLYSYHLKTGNQNVHTSFLSWVLELQMNIAHVGHLFPPSSRHIG